jgi:DNA (cytosine-5)-methyltransferase 1
MSAIQKKPAFDFKTQYGLGLDPQDDEIVVDFFCGGGGAGTGLEMGLGRPVTVAKNHNPAAISMHTANHPHARHYTTDVFEGDPDEECGGRPVGWFHMSPDCTHHSQAAGGQPRKREIRNLSWIGLKWAGKKKPRVISLENVKQILHWGPLIAKRDKATGLVMKLGGQVAAPGEVVPVQQQFLVPDPKRRGITWHRFVQMLEGMGYQVEWRIIRACDFGAPTSRERLFMIARCDGQAIVWPEPTHAKKPAKGQQKWRTAADCIDWSIPSKSIFGRKKALADATLRRVAKGMKKFVLENPQPFIVPIANWSGETVQNIDDPLRTITAWPRGGTFAMANPVMIDAAFIEQANGGFNTTPAKGADEPMTTVTNTGSQQRLVTASLLHLRGNCDSRDVAEPLHTISACGTHHGLLSAFLERQFGASVGQPVSEPAPTVTAGGGGKSSLVELKLSPEHEAGALRVAAFLIRYYGTENMSSCEDPLSTITTKDRLALVTVYVKDTPYVIVDICLRMLKPHELYRAQGFPADYIINKGADGKPFSQKDQVHMCGNSVSPPPMAALARANDPWRTTSDRLAAA